MNSHSRESNCLCHGLTSGLYLYEGALKPCPACRYICPLEELAVVELYKTLDDMSMLEAFGVEVGDVGTVVFKYHDTDFEVEFQKEGKHPILATLPRTHLLLVHPAQPFLTSKSDSEEFDRWVKKQFGVARNKLPPAQLDMMNMVWCAARESLQNTLA